MKKDVIAQDGQPCFAKTPNNTRPYFLDSLRYNHRRRCNQRRKLKAINNLPSEMDITVLADSDGAIV